MGSHLYNYSGACTVIVLGLIVGPQNLRAQDLPDLFITTDSRIPLHGSCKKDEPLWEGRIAIKNIGRADATFGVLDSLGGGSNEKATLVVYVPQNIDLLDRASLTQKLAPLDQRGIMIKIGEGRQKRCRFFSKPPRIKGHGGQHDPAHRDNADYRDYRAQRANGIASLQRALMNAGYNLPVHGDDGDYGSETRGQLKAWFRSEGNEVPPYTDSETLTGSQITSIVGRLGGDPGASTSRACTSGARSANVNVTIYAVVDPYNQIEELNEANNSATFTVNIDCSRGG